jgi:hypothetical protein
MSDTTPSQADIMQEMQQLQCRFQQLQAQLQDASRLHATSNSNNIGNNTSNDIGWQVMNGNDRARVYYFNGSAQVPRADGYQQKY